MKKISVVGNTLLDVNFELPKQYLHRFMQKSEIELPFGEKISAEDYQLTVGGSGANVAVGLAKQGYQVNFFTTLSEDGIGRFLLEKLHKEGIETDQAVTVDHSSLSIVLRVGCERTILTGRPASDPLERVRLLESGWLHIGPLHGESQKLYRRVVENKIKSDQVVSLNPSIESIEDRQRDFLVLLHSTEIIFVNQKEASVLTKSKAIIEPLELVKKCKTAE